MNVGRRSFDQRTRLGRRHWRQGRRLQLCHMYVLPHLFDTLTIVARHVTEGRSINISIFIEMASNEIVILCKVE